MISPIMMVASSPPRRDHLDLIVAASTPPLRPQILHESRLEKGTFWHSHKPLLIRSACQDFEQRRLAQYEMIRMRRG